MGFTKITELPLLLHRVERDPFLDPTRGDRAPLGGARSGDLTTTPLAKLAIGPDELRVRSRHAELAG